MCCCYSSASSVFWGRREDWIKQGNGDLVFRRKKQTMTSSNQRLESKASITILQSFLKSPQEKSQPQAPKLSNFKGLSWQGRGGTSLITPGNLGLLPTLPLLIFPPWLLWVPMATFALVIVRLERELCGCLQCDGNRGGPFWLLTLFSLALFPQWAWAGPLRFYRAECWGECPQNWLWKAK